MVAMNTNSVEFFKTHLENGFPEPHKLIIGCLENQQSQQHGTHHTNGAQSWS